MKKCSVCKKATSTILMNNRFVCFRCDELLFDLEIESDETEVNRESTQNYPTVKLEDPLTKTSRQK